MQGPLGSLPMVLGLLFCQGLSSLGQSSSDVSTVFPQEGENRPSSKKPWGAPELGQVGIDLERNQPVSSR